jgi:hypothetical protein
MSTHPMNDPRALTGFAAALLLVGLGASALLGAPTTVAAPSMEPADITVTSTTDPTVTATGATPTDEAPSVTSTSLTRVPMTAPLTETSRVLATAVPVSPTFTVSLAPSHPTGIFGQVPRRIFTLAETPPADTSTPTVPPTVSTPALPPTRTPAPPTSTTVLATPPSTTVPAVPAPGTASVLRRNPLAGFEASSSTDTVE